MTLRRRSSVAGAKPPSGALAEDRRAERQGNGARDASGGVQEDVPERPAGNRWPSPWTRRDSSSGIETEGPAKSLGMSLAGVR